MKYRSQKSLFHKYNDNNTEERYCWNHFQNNSFQLMNNKNIDNQKPPTFNSLSIKIEDNNLLIEFIINRPLSSIGADTNIVIVICYCSLYELQFSHIPLHLYWILERVCFVQQQFSKVFLAVGQHAHKWFILRCLLGRSFISNKVPHIKSRPRKRVVDSHSIHSTSARKNCFLWTGTKRLKQNPLRRLTVITSVKG